MKRIRRQRNKNLFKSWEKAGSPMPLPHRMKEVIIQNYQELYGHSLFIETGTFTGDMVAAQKPFFKKIISIELGEDLFARAQNRFIHDPNIFIIQGDSGKVLSQVIKDVNEPAIFWLDGHYSEGITAKGEKECPIFEELEAILSSKSMKHVLLIDDARCFTGKGDYPTLDALSDYLHSKKRAFNIHVKYDIIHILLN
jgi:hypothetical protein